MSRECDVCGTEYEAQRKTSRYCSTRCRTRASRRSETPATAQTLHGAFNQGPETNARTACSTHEAPASGGLVEALRRELADAGRLETALGQQAIALAVKLASPFDTGSAMAAVSRELRAVREEALRGAEQVADPLDELRLRRDVKRAGARAAHPPAPGLRSR